MFRCEGLKVVTVEVFSTHPIWFSAFFSTPASPCLSLSFQLNRFGSLRLRSWFALVRSWFAQKAKKIRFFEGLRNPGSFWFAFGSLRLRSMAAAVAKPSAIENLSGCLEFLQGMSPRQF